MMKTRISMSLVLACAAGTACANQVSFAPPATIPTAQRPGGLSLADLDGDNDLDVVFTTDAPDRLNRLINNAGVFTPAAVTLLPAGAGAGDTAAADFDNDGDADIAVIYKNTNQIQFFMNTGGVLSLGPVASTGTDARGLIVVNLDGDADLDLAMVSRDDNSVILLTNNGATWATSTIAAGEEPFAVAAADMDNDGDRDLVVSLHRERTLRVFSNAAGSFTAATTIGLGANVRPDGVALADFNGDGRVDIATSLGNNGADLVGVIFNLATGYSTVAAYSSAGVNPGPVIAFDTDNDGDKDLATLNQDSATIAILPNTGAGAFGAASLLTAGAGPDSFVVGQLAGSATPDILVSNRNGASIMLFTNAVPVGGCNDIDFNNNTVFPEDQDVIDFFAVLAGGPCSTPNCDDIDFNNNTVFPEDQDVIDFFTVLAGGPCSTQ